MKFKTNRWGAAILEPEEVVSLTGQTIYPDYFTIYPFGHWLHVVVDKPPEKFGDIIIPDTHGSREKMSVGYVFAVGPAVGNGSTPYPGGPSLTQPTDLLGARVVFGLTQGTVLRVNLIQKDLWGEVIQLTDFMVRSGDEDLRPVGERIEAVVSKDARLKLVS